MRKLAMAVVVLTLALVVVSPALAAGPGGPVGPANTFALAGVVDSVNVAVVNVTVVAASWPVKAYIGTIAEVQTTDSTVFLLKTDGPCDTISLADLAAGDAVSIHGVVTADGFIATRVTVGAELIGQ